MSERDDDISETLHKAAEALGVSAERLAEEKKRGEQDRHTRGGAKR
jgi:hypothetical protein